MPRICAIYGMANFTDVRIHDICSMTSWLAYKPHMAWLRFTLARKRDICGLGGDILLKLKKCRVEKALILEMVNGLHSI